MTDEKPAEQDPEVKEERIERPEDEVKDLELPPEESEQVRAGLDGGSKDGVFKH